MLISQDEKKLLRDLAKKQHEISNLPEMHHRKELWYALNNGQLREPLVTFEFNGPLKEVYPISSNPNDLVRFAEDQLNFNITNPVLLDDDRVIPDYLCVPVRHQFIPFNLPVKKHHPTYSDGSESIGFSVEIPVKDLEEDFHKLRKSVWSIDRNLQEAKKRREELEEVIGDILPVKIEFPSFVFDLASSFCTIQGMENMLLSLYDYPELVHRAMKMLTDDYLEYMGLIESSGAFLANNDGTFLNQGSWGYTDDLPDDAKGFSDLWGYTCSQETVTISPEMFHEFFFPYIKRLSDRLGLLSYGCCEPVDTLWENSLVHLKNLRKLSVSPWCNEEDIGAKLRDARKDNRYIVYQRKPSPNYVGVDERFDPEGLAAHIARTAKAASGCPLEITYRDVITAKGEPWRLKKAIQITKEQMQKHWSP